MNKQSRVKYISIGVLAGTLLAWASLASAEPQSYLLACKGGVGFEGLQVTSPWGGPNKGTFVYQFRKSPRKATEGLERGQCAWIDRPLNQSEPSKMVIHQEDMVLVVSSGSNGDLTIDVRTRNQANPPHLQPLKRLLRSLSSGGDFQVQAYTAKNGLLRVTKIGP